MNRFKPMLLLGFTAVLAACASDPGLPVLTSSQDPDALVCAIGEMQYCERLSAYVWAKCECISVAR